jgi:hypothetical protein
MNLNDPLGTSGEITTDPRVLERRALGSAYGLELFLRRPFTRRIAGFLAYTLSRNTRSYGRVSGLSAFDRTHVFNLAIAFDLGRRWTVGARALLFSGVPTRRPSPAGPVFEGSDRAPAFARLDLRLEKRWRLGKQGSWGLTAEVLNSTLSREITRRNCNEVGCTEDAVGPIFVPSLGVDVRY